MDKRNLMGMWALLLAVLAALALPGFAEAASRSVSPAQTPLPPLPEVSPPAETVDMEGESAMESILIADAARYRGTVLLLEPRGEGTLCRLERAPGTNYVPTLEVLLGAELSAALEPAVGDYLEVWYGGDITREQPVDAIAGEKLLPAELVVYSGTLAAVEGEGADLRLVLQNSDTPPETPAERLCQYQTVFHAGEAQFYMDRAALVPGAALSVYHRGMMTRSLPPQGVALEVALLAE